MFTLAFTLLALTPASTPARTLAQQIEAAIPKTFRVSVRGNKIRIAAPAREQRAYFDLDTLWRGQAIVELAVGDPLSKEEWRALRRKGPAPRFQTDDGRMVTISFPLPTWGMRLWPEDELFELRRTIASLLVPYEAETESARYRFAESLRAIAGPKWTVSSTDGRIVLSRSIRVGANNMNSMGPFDNREYGSSFTINVMLGEPLGTELRAAYEKTRKKAEDELRETERVLHASGCYLKSEIMCSEPWTEKKRNAWRRREKLLSERTPALFYRLTDWTPVIIVLDRPPATLPNKDSDDCMAMLAKVESMLAVYDETRQVIEFSE